MKTSVCFVLFPATLSSYKSSVFEWNGIRLFG